MKGEKLGASLFEVLIPNKSETEYFSGASLNSVSGKGTCSVLSYSTELSSTKVVLPSMVTAVFLNSLVSCVMKASCCLSCSYWNSFNLFFKPLVSVHFASSAVTASLCAAIRSEAVLGFISKKFAFDLVLTFFLDFGLSPTRR